MKTGVPWSLRGIDEETREAILRAARQEGLTVSEWLNRSAGEDAVDRVHADDQAADDTTAIAESIDRLTARLRSMDEASRASVPRLTGRLDEIERHLGRLPDREDAGAERARSLKGVETMVAALARDIENADEQARTMVEGTRKPAADPGVARVTDAIRDLDQRIAAMSERIGPPITDEASVPRLDDIRYRLNALLAEKPKAAKAPPPAPPSRAAGIDAALRSLETRIDAAKARLVAPRDARPPEAASSGEAEQIARIEERLAAIGERLAAKAAPPKARAAAKPADAARRPPSDTHLAGAIAEISAHQRALDERAETMAMRRDQKALSAAMAALRADIAALTQQVATIGRNGAEDQGATFDLSRRIEALSAERPLDRSLLSAIRSDLETLRNTVTEQSGRPGIDALDARTATIVDRLEELQRRAPDRSRLDALGEEVSALRRALEADDSPRAIQRLEMRLAELGRSLEAALSNSRHAPAPDPGVERLEQRLDAIARDLTNRIAERSPAPADPAIRGLEGRLDEIAARIDGLLDRAPGAAAFATMEEKLQELTDSVSGLSASQRQPAAALDEIKAEIAAIRRDIAGHAPPSTAHLEGQIRELAQRLETATRPESGNQGLAELEAQVARLAGQLEGSQPRAIALKQVEESLDRLQSHLADNHRESIEAARAEARAAVRELAATVGDREIDSDLIRALRMDLDSLRTAAGDTSAATHSTLASVNRTLNQVVDRLGRLESETVAEAAEAVFRLPSPVPAAGPELAVARETVPEAKKPTDRRADFIAAARRAAQAAAAEAAMVEPSPPATEETSEPRERKPGAFARISQAIRSRNRPLLLAAAAIVLAIGAMRIYGAFTGAPNDGELIASAPPVAAVQRRDVARTVPTVPRVADSALVAPAPTTDPAITFAAPEAFGGRFGEAPQAPAIAGFGTPALPAAAAAALPPPAAQKPITLASASAEPPPVAGRGPAPDSRIGSDKLVRAAASGDAAAAFEVAARYADGNRVPKNLAKAAEWYERAAVGGIAVAQYRFASLNERGQGVAKNLTKAVEWYQRAADQGNINAMHNLAVLMSEGVEGAPDHDKALQWFLAAGEYGVRDSQYNLGVIFARGLGTAQDLIASYKWFAIAAAQGDTDAGQRRDDVAKMLPGDDLAKARAAAQAWHVKPPLPEANGVSTPDGGWDGPGDTLGEADRQAMVKKIQALLADQGFDPGPADGIVGDKTRDAVRAYQRKNGIAETGRIDNTLIASLADTPL